MIALKICQLENILSSEFRWNVSKWHARLLSLLIVPRQPCPQKAWLWDIGVLTWGCLGIRQSQKPRAVCSNVEERGQNFRTGYLLDMHACKVAVHEKKVTKKFGQNFTQIYTRNRTTKTPLISLRDQKLQFRLPYVYLVKELALVLEVFTLFEVRRPTNGHWETKRLSLLIGLLSAQGDTLMRAVGVGSEGHRKRHPCAHTKSRREFIPGHVSGLVISLLCAPQDGNTLTFSDQRFRLEPSFCNNYLTSVLFVYRDVRLRII